MRGHAQQQHCQSTVGVVVFVVLLTKSTQSAPPVRSESLDGASRRSRLRRPSVNITAPERAGRIVIGLLAIIAGAVLLVAAENLVVVLLEVLLMVAGVDLVVTGALGHCPLYRKLGHIPSSLRKPT